MIRNKSIRFERMYISKILFFFFKLKILKNILLVLVFILKKEKFIIGS